MPGLYTPAIRTATINYPRVWFLQVQARRPGFSPASFWHGSGQDQCPFSLQSMPTLSNIGFRKDEP